jgi:hypothetical protein
MLLSVSKRNALSLCVFSFGMLLLAGCSGSFAPGTVEPGRALIGNIQGSVHGGQAPVTGAQIYLFAAGTGGYGTSATSLITSGSSGVTCNTTGTLKNDCYVTTDGGGNFSLGGDYSCTEGTQVYMVAVGGNPGMTPGGFSTVATFAKNSSTITVASATWVNVGMTVSGTGVSGTVTAVVGTTVTLSQQTTAAGTNAAVTFSTSGTTATFSNNSSTITVASASGIGVGMLVSGTGLGGTVTAVAGTTVTLSQKTTSAGTNVAVTFAVPVNNTAIVQMAALGQCPAAGNLAAQVPYLVINEVTTVAFGYSMSGFATTAYNVSSDATGATALANAFANAGNIVNLQYGQAPTTANGNTNSVNPQTKIYALANILANCVNTSSSTSSQCVNLFSYATQGTAQATDESNAIFNIAHNQAQNVGNLWNLTPATPVFTPSLAAQPTDWTIPVIYKGLVSEPNTTGNSIVSGPFNIAFDANGNAWIGDRVKGVVEVGPQGAATAYNKGFGMVKGVAISPVDGSIWVSDFGSNQLDVMNSSGTIITTITTDLQGPILTAFSGNVSGRSSAYQANETTTGIVIFDSVAYTVNTFQTTNYGNVDTPGWISVDQTGTGWIPSTSTAYFGTLSVKEKGKSGNYTYTAAENNGVPSSYSTVSDGNGNIWMAQITGTATLEEITAGNTSVQGTWTGGGMNGPYKVAVDGGNDIWIANANANTVSGFNPSGSGTWLSSTGFSTGAQGGAGCVVAAPDPSGNLWAANSDGSVTQLLGLSTPTAAPFYGGTNATSGSTAGNLGTKP